MVSNNKTITKKPQTARNNQTITTIQEKIGNVTVNIELPVDKGISTNLSNIMVDFQKIIPTKTITGGELFDMINIILTKYYTYLFCMSVNALVENETGIHKYLFIFTKMNDGDFEFKVSEDDLPPRIIPKIEGVYNF